MDFALLAQQTFSWFSPQSWWAIAQVVIGIGLVIFVHELGHFLVAKACGVKCEKFYVGFDMFDVRFAGRVIIPRALLKFQWGETEYGIGIVPLGGYVKMLGQDDNPSNIRNERQRTMATDQASAGGVTTSAIKAGSSGAAHVSQQPGPAASETHSAVESAAGPIDRSQLNPRSYQAKSVGQRMAIISAGVVMNLIFAVVFASIAFMIGVRYQPPAIGETLPGGPAWEQDLAGSEVLHIAGRDTRDRYFTFVNLQEAIVLSGAETPIEIQVQRPGEPPRWATVRPRARLIPEVAFALIGISEGTTTRLPSPPTLPGQIADSAQPPFAGDDTIIAVNGTSTPSAFELRAALAASADQPITLTVDREETQIDIQVPPNPMRSLGINMELGQITAIQVGSPASAADLAVGDQLLAIDGQPIGDVFTLPQRLLPAAREGREITLHLLRSEGETPQRERFVTVVPRLPRSPISMAPNLPIAIDALGIAIEVTNRVDSVRDGSPAAAHDIRPGDEVVHVRYRLPADFQDEHDLFQLRITEGPVGRLDFPSHVWTMAQHLPPGSTLELRFRRGSTEFTAAMSAALMQDTFLETRGIRLVAMSREYEARSVGEAIGLGVRQTGNDVRRVWTFLVKLIRGDISITNLGGPGTIAVVATFEATAGTSRLLLFLTLLSANLAIINFLPIPVLDGGHMVFLTYEAIFRRTVSERVQVILSFAGLVFIICLMLFVIFLDIGRLASW